MILGAAACQASLIAGLHAECFSDAWAAADIARLMAMPGALSSLACDERGSPVGFLVARRAADEAEIITLGIRPEARRRGFAGHLIQDLVERLKESGVSRLHIEVAAGNRAGLAFYAAQGFEPAGRRPGYYAQLDGRAEDAILMRLQF